MRPDQAEMAEMVTFRREWRVRLKKRPVAEWIAAFDRFYELVKRHQHHLDEDERILEELDDWIEIARTKLISREERDCPIAYFDPSWEQAQAMNCWSPEFEPAVAPQGYNSVGNFSGVRTGKTWAKIADTILWIVPNDPDWPVFEPRVDPLGRGTYRVLPRPNWDYWWKTGKMVPPDSDEPPKSACEIWQGVPDELHWHQKVEKYYRRWFPDKWIKREGKEVIWRRAERYFVTKFGHTISCKLYGSDQQAWAGEEVWRTNLDEGPPIDKLDEVVFRSRYIHWCFTPREAANTGDRARIARKVWKGEYDLVGKTKFFFWRIADVPVHIMDPRDKRGRLEKAGKMGEAGRVAAEGGFFNSSPVVFDQFAADFHVLPVTGAQVVAAIRGELDSLTLAAFPWLEKFHRANIIRGFDEGLAHPTACAWVALLRSGESVFFRDWEAAATSITERVEKIIDLSGNRREEIKRTVHGMTENQIEIVRQYAPQMLQDAQRERATGAKLTRYHEIMVREYVRRTFADSKIFKRDPAYPLDDWTQNYIRAGLRMERAANIGPAARCDYVNTLLRPDSTREHLNPEQGRGLNRHGAALYMTMDCTTLRMRMEEYLWGQIKGGDRRGEFTGKPEELFDDLIDASAYPLIARLRWVDPAQYRRAAIMPMAA